MALLATCKERATLRFPCLEEGPQTRKCGFAQVGNSDCAPWFPSAKNVEVTTVPTVERRTLRIAAPDFFRQPFLGQETQDSRSSPLWLTWGNAPLLNSMEGVGAPKVNPKEKNWLYFSGLRKFCVAFCWQLAVSVGFSCLLSLERLKINLTSSLFGSVETQKNTF